MQEVLDLNKRRANNMNEQLAEQIAKAYNKVMRSYFKEGVKSGRTDIETITDPRYSDMWEAVFPYLEHAEHVWLRWQLNNETVGVKFPHIGTFAGYGMLEELFKNLHHYEGAKVKQHCITIIDNLDLAQQIATDMGVKLDVTNSYRDVEVYRGDKLNANNYTNNSERKKYITAIASRINEELHL